MGLFMSKDTKNVYEWAKSSQLFKYVDCKKGIIWCSSAKYTDLAYHINPSADTIMATFLWINDYGSAEDTVTFADRVEQECAHAIKDAAFDTYLN